MWARARGVSRACRRETDRDRPCRRTGAAPASGPGTGRRSALGSCLGIRPAVLMAEIGLRDHRRRSTAHILTSFSSPPHHAPRWAGEPLDVPALIAFCYRDNPFLL